jgi:hypothetical protein
MVKKKPIFDKSWAKDYDEFVKRIRCGKRSHMRIQPSNRYRVDFVKCMTDNGVMILELVAQKLGITWPNGTKKHVLIGKILREDQKKACIKLFVRSHQQSQNDRLEGILNDN